jgi:hypothetical protein
MRPILFALLLLPLAVPASAQRPASPGDKVAAMAPAMDRATGALLDLDIGPILDAADPYHRRPAVRHRTLRDIARRDDPYFEQRLRGRIYGTTAAMARMADAIAAATPAMRRSLDRMKYEIDAAARDARQPLPPGDADDGWDRDLDDDGPDGEPYDE